MNAARLIRLRRPPVLHVQPEPFVPNVQTQVLEQAEQRWRTLCASNPAYFDGRIWHVLGVHRNGYGGASIHVMECAYRWHAVQKGWRDLGVRSLGVKGLLFHDGRVLMGRRAVGVSAYEGMWEFAPSGVVDGGMQPRQAILEELREEVGLVASADPVAVAILYDEVLDCWEIAYRLRATVTDDIRFEPREYDSVRWVDPAALADERAGEQPGELTPMARQMTALLQANRGRTK